MLCIVYSIFLGGFSHLFFEDICGVFYGNFSVHRVMR